MTSIRVGLEVHLHAESRQSPTENCGRGQPHRVVVVQRTNIVAIQCVVEIQVDRGAQPAERKWSRESQIELVRPLSIHGSRIDEVYRHVCRSARERTTQ